MWVVYPPVCLQYPMSSYSVTQRLQYWEVLLGKDGILVMDMLFLLSLYLALGSSIVSVLSSDNSEPVQTSEGPYVSALQYLTKYGYLNQGQNRNLSLFDSFENSLRRFQEFFSMPQSGELDSETVRAMEKPRCGLGDTTLDQGEVRQVDLLGEGGAKKRQKRYSFYDSFFFQDIMDLFRTRIRPFDTPSR